MRDFLGGPDALLVTQPTLSKHRRMNSYLSESRISTVRITLNKQYLAAAAHPVQDPLTLCDRQCGAHIHFIGYELANVIGGGLDLPHKVLYRHNPLT